MTDTAVKQYGTVDEWLAANPLYQWRGSEETPRSMRAAADLIEVSQTTIMLWERGENSALPKHKYMVRIAELLELSVATLYTVWQAWLDAKPVEDAQPVERVA